jgi:hypothetical protein
MMNRRAGQRRMRPSVMALEDRQLLATFTVINTLGDGTPGSLRWAIGQANANAGADTIAFDGAAFATPQTIALGGTQLDLTDTTGATTITGPAAGVTVSGGGASRVFKVNAMVAASISGVTISGGRDDYLGGGIYVYRGTIDLTDCTLSGNSAGYGGGGGLRLRFGTATLANCTISGNSSGRGSGLFVGYGSTAALTNCTVSGNSGSAGMIAYGTAALRNTIVAGNESFDLGGTVTGTNNLIGRGSGGLVNGVDGNIIVGVANPGLSPLGHYGGPSPTVALLPGSPALDAGTAAGAPATDQRGVGRVGPVDIGAFESRGFQFAIDPGSTPQAAPIGTPFPNPLAIRVTANNPVEPVDGGAIPFVAHPAADGASAIFLDATAVIAGGMASLTAAPNNVTGSYTVAATSGTYSVSFALTNTGTPFAELIVNTTSDALTPGPGLLSLRLAVAFNNASTTGNAPITFDAGLGGVFSVPRTIVLGGSPLDLSNPSGTAAITAPAAGVTIDGGGRSGVFRVRPNVTAALTGLTITGGRSSADGGGVLNDGTATLAGCTIRGNSASSNGGGVAGGSGATTLINCTVTGNSSTFSGGGLSNRGALTMTGCTVSDNAIDYGGGAGVANFGGALAMTGCTISNNTARDFFSSGGGVLSDSGSLTMTGCTIAGNRGGIGGGLYTSLNTTTLTGCTIINNATAIGPGGGLMLDTFSTATLTDCTISGNASNVGVIFNGVSGGGGLAVSWSDVTMTGCTVTNNWSAVNGGGISVGNYFGSTTLDRCTISGNRAGGNGGGVSFNFGPATLTGCTVSGNAAGGNGGGLYNDSGTVSLTNSTVSGNSAVNGGGLSSSGFTFYGTSFLGATSLADCTVSGNTASGSGGGLNNAALSSTTLTGTTVRANAAASGGGIANAGTLGVASSRILNNTATSRGGGLSTTGGTASIVDSVLNSNLVSDLLGTVKGGGIYAEDAALSLTRTTVNANRAVGASAFGGGIYALDSAVSLTDATVNGNWASGSIVGQGGGIYSSGGTLTLVKSRVKGNRASTAFDDLFRAP